MALVILVIVEYGLIRYLYNEAIPAVSLYY